jgi:hypothetical protein
MMGHILAAGQVTTVSSAVTSGTTWFLLILAAAAGARFGWLAPIGVFVLYLLMHAGPLHHAPAVSSTTILLVVIAVIGGFVGWQIGGRGILRDLGAREYDNRLTTAKDVRSMWKRWFN